MLVLNKKRIFIAVIIVFVGVLVGMQQLHDYNKNNVDNKKNSKSITTMGMPISNKVIVIDAGHGKPDEGAESSNGTTEAQINLKIALKVQNLIEQSGGQVVLTRSDENGIYDLDSETLRQKKISDIRNRVKIGNESSADIFVSIHLNKILQENYYGWQTFYNKKSLEGQNLAKSIQKSLNESIQKDNQRVPSKIENVYIINNVEIPITIVECGFLSNKLEEKDLLDDLYQDKLAWGIYNGIMNYFNDM